MPATSGKSAARETAQTKMHTFVPVLLVLLTGLDQVWYRVEREWVLYASNGPRSQVVQLPLLATHNISLAGN